MPGRHLTDHHVRHYMNRGATWERTHGSYDPQVFQSAPPCGGRLEWAVDRCGAEHGFNPRPRAGGDVNGHCRARLA